MATSYHAGNWFFRIFANTFGPLQDVKPFSIWIQSLLFIYKYPYYSTHIAVWKFLHIRIFPRNVINNLMFTWSLLLYCITNSCAREYIINYVLAMLMCNWLMLIGNLMTFTSSSKMAINISYLSLKVPSSSSPNSKLLSPCSYI